MITKKQLKSVLDRSTVITLLICVILIALISGGSLANRTYKSITENKITSGQIKVSLINTRSDGSEMPEYIYSILPNTQIDNVVKVKNTCDEDEYIRVKLAINIKNEYQQDLDTEHITFNYDSAKWTYKDGYYYYNEVLKANETSDILYDFINIGSEINNSYKKASMTVDIDVDAVQVVNNGSSVFEATGWEES